MKMMFVLVDTGDKGDASNFLVLGSTPDEALKELDEIYEFSSFDEHCDECKRKLRCLGSPRALCIDDIIFQVPDSITIDFKDLDRRWTNLLDIFELRKFPKFCVAPSPWKLVPYEV